MNEFISPVKVENSKYREHYLKKLEFDFGNFYIFDTYVIGEISEGIHFNWDLASKVIYAVYDYFGTTDLKVAYISNRVNSYSVQPKDWMQFFKERHHIKCIAVVAYSKLGWMSVVLEKIFSNAPIKKFKDLDSAIDWAINSKEQKKFPKN
ncbi:MAG: hypothetical protein Aureis2KO_11590 [Aureisphaera sp.]